MLKGLFASYLNEKLSAFKPYSLNSVSKIKNIPLSNLVSVGGSFLVDISKSSIFSLDMNPFFNFEENTSKIQYTGAEFLLNLEINPTNDFYLSFGLGDFLTSDKENQIYFDINLKLNY